LQVHNAEKRNCGGQRHDRGKGKVKIPKKDKRQEQEKERKLTPNK